MDSLIEKVGYFGRYQKMVTCLISSMTSLVAMSTYASVFNNAVPKFICRNNKGVELPNSCQIYKNTTNGIECAFDKEFYGETIVTSWDLHCEKMYLTNLTQTVFMVGALSSFFAGIFSDKYGRRFVCLAMSIILSLSIIICEALQAEMFNLSNETLYLVYLTSQFFLGFSSFILYIVSYILLIEIISTKYSMLVSIININIYVVGELILLIASYLLRNWHHQNIFLSIYSLVIVCLIFFFLPESPKFLVANKQYNEAALLLSKMSKFNGKKITFTEKDIRASINANADPEKEAMFTENKINDANLKNINNKNSVMNYFTNPITNLVKTCILGYLFIALSMIYFGVSLGITSISDDFNPYYMYLYSCVAEIIGYSMGMLDRKVSRKILLMVSLGLAGVMCILVALIPLSPGRELTWNSIFIIAFASIGKVMASAAFNLIYLYASQFFPIGVRNTIVSYVTCAGRVGSILSPQINLLKSINRSLPYIIFSGNAFLSCFLVFFMPDTNEIKHNI